MRRPEPCQVAVAGTTTPTRAPPTLGLDLSPETLALLEKYTDEETAMITTSDFLGTGRAEAIPELLLPYERPFSPLSSRGGEATAGTSARESVLRASEGYEDVWLPKLTNLTPHAEDETPPPYGSWEGTESLF